MQTITFRNEEHLTTSEVLDLFKKELEKSENFDNSDIEELVEIYAKNPVDKFIISDTNLLQKTFGRQGDILFWIKGSEMYNKEIKNIKNLKSTNRLVLQQNDSLTGDHKVIPLTNSKYTIRTGKFTPSFLQGKNSFRQPEYDCILLNIDKPFLVFHREHGNMAYPAGEYMICTQLNAETLGIMLD